MWEVILSKKAQGDLEKLTKAGLFSKVKELVAILRENPFASPPYLDAWTGSFLA